jgi:hypothetical protein
MQTMKTMKPTVPVFEDEDEPFEMAPLKTRRGVTVITEHGRAVTFGLTSERTKQFLKTMAQGKNHEIMAAMQAHKAARLKTSRRSY